MNLLMLTHEEYQNVHQVIPAHVDAIGEPEKKTGYTRHYIQYYQELARLEHGRLPGFEKTNS
jgi:hypothetical protein